MNEKVYAYKNKAVFFGGLFVRAKKSEYVIRKKVLAVLLMIALLFLLVAVFLQEKRKYALHDRLVETETFREMHVTEELLDKITELQKQSGLSKGRLLALTFAGTKASFPGRVPTLEQLERTAEWVYRYRPREYELLENGFCAVWNDLECFPVKCQVSYEDSWMAERNYGGNRGHEGTDLMPPVNQNGFYPIYSITAGTIEHMGWLEKGGWRIGIRSGHGGYFYYAHLSDYAKGLEEGKTVEAGEMLGYMGDSGYGKEGTTGQFAVHLHFGIYIQTADGREVSVNPYWILKSLETEH
jgi:hypothetical protein